MQEMSSAVDGLPLVYEPFPSNLAVSESEYGVPNPKNTAETMSVGQRIKTNPSTDLITFSSNVNHTDFL